MNNGICFLFARARERSEIARDVNLSSRTHADYRCAWCKRAAQMARIRTTESHVDSPPMQSDDQVACRWTSLWTARTLRPCWFSPSQTQHHCECLNFLFDHAICATFLPAGIRSKSKWNGRVISGGISLKGAHRNSLSYHCYLYCSKNHWWGLAGSLVDRVAHLDSTESRL